MSLCPTFNCSEPRNIHLELQAYPDISGKGVIIGFVGTTYFVFILAVANYFLAYDPERYPFLEQPDATNRHTPPPATLSTQLSNNPSWWRPNPIDVVFLRWIRRIATKLISNPGTTRIWDSQRAQITHAFDLCIRSLCDIQLLTGFGILISGYNALECGLSAYHWQVVVHLAWFTCVTHLIGLTTLRRYLNDRPWERFIRYILALILLGLLLAALVPTAFFNWSAYGFSLAEESSPAICFFNFLEQRKKFKYELEQCLAANTPDCWWLPDQGLQWSHALQSMAFSSALLIYSFIVRTVKLFRFLSAFASNYLDACLGSLKALALRTIVLVQDLLMRLGYRSMNLGSRGNMSNPSVSQMLFSAASVSLRINIDLLNSVVAEVYWLFVLLLWGTIRLASALSISNQAVRDAENAWTFGQVLPIVLLAAPIVTALETFSPIVASPRMRETQINWPEERRLALIRPPIVGHSLNSQPGSVSASTEMNTLLPIRQTTITDDGMSGPINPHGTNGITPSTTSQAIYRDAEWSGPCFAIQWMAIFLFTLLCVFTAYNPGHGVEFPPLFTPLFTLFDLWYSQIKIFNLALTSYPAANISVVFLGIYMEHWRSSTNRQSWTIAEKLLFSCIASFLGAIHIVLWWSFAIIDTLPFPSPRLLPFRLLGNWLLLALLYGLLVLLRIVCPPSYSITI
ncbi:hypothetical protein F5Y08DRAFT_52948 [Xylaria arbuscula]|nr:hypothetical protein F5Y08DRAFT_52948 [Xylaria arbuscula]